MRMTTWRRPADMAPHIIADLSGPSPWRLTLSVGDFTHFGKQRDVEDFNAWLGELRHRLKIVVNGNHECNADWSSATARMLSNAHFLCDQAAEFHLPAAANANDPTTTGNVDCSAVDEGPSASASASRNDGTTNATASSTNKVSLRVFG